MIYSPLLICWVKDNVSASTTYQCSARFEELERAVARLERCLANGDYEDEGFARDALATAQMYREEAKQWQYRVVW